MSPILRVLATLLSLVMLMTAGVGGGRDHDVKDPDACRLNFAVLSDMLKFMSIEELFRNLVPISLILGVGIGFLGSLITVRRHLKV